MADQTTAELPAVPGPSLKAVEQSDLAGLIAVAQKRAGEASTLAERLESLVSGLSGADTSRAEGAPVPSPCGLNDLSDALDRTGASHDRASGLIDRLNALVAIGG